MLKYMETTPVKLEPLLTPKEAAAYLGISIQSLTRLEKEDGLPVHRLGKSANALKRYNRAEILDWLQKMCSERDAGARSDQASHGINAA